MSSITAFRLYFLFYIVNCASAFDPYETKSEDFDVKPGGMVQDHEFQWDEIKCKFTYACQGGTNEKWLFSIARDQGNTEYSCTVERPSGTSYLFFQQFQMESFNFHLTDAYAESQSGRSLSPQEYSFDSSKNTVSHVEGHFNSQLAKLAVVGTKFRAEL